METLLLHSISLVFSSFKKELFQSLGKQTNKKHHQQKLAKQTTTTTHTHTHQTQNK